MCFYRVISGEHGIHFIYTIFVNNITQLFFLTYKANFFDGEWVHGIYKGEEVCDGHILVEGINSLLLRDQ